MPISRHVQVRGNREGGSPGQANQAFSVLRALINYAGRQYKKQDGMPLVLHNRKRTVIPPLRAAA